MIWDIWGVLLSHGVLWDVLGVILFFPGVIFGLTLSFWEQFLVGLGVIPGCWGDFGGFEVILGVLGCV